MNTRELISPELQKELIEFTRDLVRIRSVSGHEEEVVRSIAARMKALGYDEVTIDSMGNVVGRIGHGSETLLFDSHIDTVAVNDEAEWDVPPFSGEIVDGQLYGRGSVDMKSGAAASVYAGAIAKQLGLTAGRTLYVSCSVFEEDCDGENLKNEFKELKIQPDAVVICEPSNNIITLGHKGKAQITIQTHGVSAHGSAPEKGVNAIYEMAEIIQRVEKTNADLAKIDGHGPHGTLVMSNISSVSASMNAVPSECEVYLDRRIIPGETEEDIQQEVEQIVQGKKATWKIDLVHRKSWTGMDINYKPFHMAWKIDPNQDLTRACTAAYRETFGKEPTEYDFWDFSTNAVAPVSMGIPTIGFGPGEYKLAHMRNENCAVSQIIDACGFYIQLIQNIGG